MGDGAGGVHTHPLHAIDVFPREQSIAPTGSIAKWQTAPLCYFLRMCGREGCGDKVMFHMVPREGKRRRRIIVDRASLQNPWQR